MKKKLIINADDFGLHTSINSAVIDAYENGVLTSTTLVANGNAFENALFLLEKHKCAIGVGVHLTLVAETPVLAPSLVSTLIDKNGLMYKNYTVFLKKFLQGKIDKKEIYAELKAQILKIKKHGITITHLDSHQHLHVFPGIRKIICELAKKFNIKNIRYPKEPYFFNGGFKGNMMRKVGKWGLAFCTQNCKKLFKANKLSYPLQMYGMLAGGHINEDILKNVLISLPMGLSEIMTHPATDNNEMKKVYQWDFDWENELSALKSENIKKLITLNNIVLQSYCQEK